MAILPAALEKLLGIYFLTRICIDMFKLAPGSWVSLMLMIIGSVTILFAVMMALIQKDFRRLLSYHAMSQVGYMILGIGTLLPAVLSAVYSTCLTMRCPKSCLFLSAGSVESGLYRFRPAWRLKAEDADNLCLFCRDCAVDIRRAAVQRFFLKELIYDAALERGWLFYLAAAGGLFLPPLRF